VLTEVRMPKLGMAMKKGKVERWLVAEGEPVEQDKPLFELTTDKVNAVIDAPTSGLLGRVLVPEGTELKVGELLAVIGDPDDDFAGLDDLVGATDPPVAPGSGNGGRSPAPKPASAVPASGGEVSASPAARRRAKELGIDIGIVTPRQPGKRLTTEDVEAFAAGAVAPGVSEPVGPSDGMLRTLPFDGIRRIVAERLHESLQTMAQVTISREAVVAGMVNRRQELALGFETATGVRLTYTDLLIQAVASLLSEHGLLNAALADGSIVISGQVHMGFAVALEDGLIVPVIRDAHEKSLGDIATERVELSTRAQAGTLSIEDIEGGTFTISNLGAFGADAFTPIVNPPQCAILGVGRIVEKPVVRDGSVAIAPTLWLSLTFDHRLIDGAPAARFLQALAERLA